MQGLAIPTRIFETSKLQSVPIARRGAGVQSRRPGWLWVELRAQMQDDWACVRGVTQGIHGLKVSSASGPRQNAHVGAKGRFRDEVWG